MAIIKRLASEDYVSSKATEVVDVALDEHVVSWNDLEDKPFGEESVSSRNTVYETTVDNTDGKLAYRILSYNIAPLNNRNVVVTVNGVEYESVCTFNGGSGYYSIALGDGVHYINQSVLDNNASITKLEAAIYEVKIETIETAETIVPLDQKYIPDSIARVEDLSAPKTELILTSSTADSTKKFKITIDDEGVITATEIVESEA